MYLPVSIAILIGDVKKTIKLKTKTTNVKTKTMKWEDQDRTEKLLVDLARMNLIIYII